VVRFGAIVVGARCSSGLWPVNFERPEPEAILKFRQDVDRLIRTKTDQGIIMALHNRILTKQYGPASIDALPKCPVELLA
jgi:hypothetical protein